MKHIGLFEGIGGFSLAAKWAGWETVAWCEINKFCQRVLKYHFPEAEGFGDIKETDFTKFKNAVDIVTGGFPCQPYSTAGKRKGKEDERHLWPEMLRAIREIQPRYVVGENVRGLTNWNGGLVFDEVQANLEAEGYEVLPFLLPACAVNAPHRRDRIWFVAHADRHRQPIQSQHEDKRRGELGINPDGDGKRLQGWSITRQTTGGGQPINQQLNGYGKCNHGGWERFPTQPPICDGNDGFPGKLVGLSFSGWRRESIKSLGNAVVPPLVYELFKSINAYEAMQSA